MEQDIIDSSKYKISIYSLDSRFADSRTSVNSEFRVMNPTPIKNVMRVRLSSAEIPLVEHVFSAERGNVVFNVALRSFVAPYDFINKTTVPIPEGNYTGDSLCTAVQTVLRLIHPGFSCGLDPVSKFVTLQNTGVEFMIDFSSVIPEIAKRSTHWGLGYYLGFRTRILTGSLVTLGQMNSTHTITGTSTISVSPNPYYLIELRCPDSLVSVYHRVDRNAYIEAFAKVILKGNSYQIQYDDGSNLLRKEQTFLAPVTIPYFQVRISDPWGVQVNMLNNDWSLALEITEVVNSKTYADLSKTFSR
jgi:hypothetical protein